MTEPPNDPIRTSALVEYARTIRRHKLLIGVIVCAFVAGSLVASLAQKKTYTAKATVLFEDPSQALSLTGTSGAVILSAQQRAQLGADTLVTPSLLTTVKQRLNTPLSTSALNGLITTSADPASSQVTVQAQGSSGQFAANLANDVATFGASQQAASQRAQYALAARQLDALRRKLGNSAASNSERAAYADQISRLRTLSTLAQPVQVLTAATVPGTPSSPTPVSSAILFAFLGFFVGLIATYFREAFDRRLGSVSDIEEGLGLPVLGQIGEDAMGKAGASTAGLGALSDADLEAFRILRTNLRMAGSRKAPKSILVTSPMPQEGKSTVAASLAFSYAAAGLTTLLVECDFRRPSLAERLGVDARVGLINYLRGECQPKDIVQAVPDPHAASGNGNRSRVARGVANLTTIVAGEHAERDTSELLESPLFMEFLREVGEVYDAVLIDTAPLLPVADTLELIDHADAIVMCVRASRTTRDQARAGRAALQPVIDHVSGVVVTGITPKDRGQYGYYGYYGKYDYRAAAGDPEPVAAES